MHRINTSGAAPGNLFKQSPAPATQVGAAWLNDVQENLARAIEAFGVGLVAGDYDQLKGALAGVGLPGRAAITDLDALDRSGFFTSSAAATGRPAGTAEGMVFSAYDAAGDVDGAQLFLAVSNQALYARTWSGAAWSAWSRLLAAGGAVQMAAMATFNGQGINGGCTVQLGSNAGSVSRSAGGAYTFYFDAALPSSVYGVTISCSGQNVVGNYVTRAAGYVTMVFQNGNANVGSGPQDPGSVTVTIWQ